MPSTKTNMTPKITATRHELIFFASPVIFCSLKTQTTSYAQRWYPLESATRGLPAFVKFAVPLGRSWADSARFMAWPA